MSTGNTNQNRSRWVKLSAETWDDICAQYAAGATARALAEKYGTSITSVYRHVVQNSMTKAKASDGVARQRAAVAEAESAEATAAAVAYMQEVALMPTSALTLHLERVSLNLLAEMLSKQRIADARALVMVMEALSRRALSEREHERVQAARETASLFENPLEAAALLERRALAQAEAAAALGRASDAKTFAVLAEQMRKRAGTLGAEQAQEEEERELAQEETEAMVCDLFAQAAYIANAMVHAPTQAPAAFQGLVKLWREQNLGEGEADAGRAAAKLAAAQAAYLDGRFEASLPDFVRERMDAAWQQRRAELAERPPMGGE